MRGSSEDGYSSMIKNILWLLRSKSVINFERYVSLIVLYKETFVKLTSPLSFSPANVSLRDPIILCTYVDLMLIIRHCGIYIKVIFIGVAVLFFSPDQLNAFVVSEQGITHFVLEEIAPK